MYLHHGSEDMCLSLYLEGMSKRLIAGYPHFNDGGNPVYSPKLGWYRRGIFEINGLVLPFEVPVTDIGKLEFLREVGGPDVSLPSSASDRFALWRFLAGSHEDIPTTITTRYNQTESGLFDVAEQLSNFKLVSLCPWSPNRLQALTMDAQSIRELSQKFELRVQFEDQAETTIVSGLSGIGTPDFEVGTIFPSARINSWMKFCHALRTMYPAETRTGTEMNTEKDEIQDKLSKALALASGLEV